MLPKCSSNAHTLFGMSTQCPSNLNEALDRTLCGKQTRGTPADELNACVMIPSFGSLSGY